MPEYDYYVFLSAPAFLLDMDSDFFKSKKNFIWIGSEYEKETVAELKEKFGGEVKIYPQTGYAYSVFFRNHEVYDDLISILNK